MTMPQMARLLGITRNEVYSIIGRKTNQGIVGHQIIIIEDALITSDCFLNK